MSALPNIRITVDLFGNWRDLVGSPSMGIDLPVGSNLQSAVTLLASRYGREFQDWLVNAESGQLWNSFSMALNGKFVDQVLDLDWELAEGDRLSFFHPVVGGNGSN